MQSNCLSWFDENSIQKASHALGQGKIILSTTDTVLGLLANTSLEGKSSVDNLKIRNKKPYIVLCESVHRARSLSENTLYRKLYNFMQRCWPGPVTLICTARSTVPLPMQSAQKTIALRVPNHPSLQKLLSLTGPLFSTSANKSGMPIPLTLDAVDPDIKQGSAFIVFDEMSPIAQASTILDCTGEEIRIVREGAYPIEKLKEYSESLFKRVT